MTKRSRFLIFSSVSAVIVTLGVFLMQVSSEAAKTRVVFMDVGEGDAILISQGSKQVLIDGGRNGKTLLSKIGRHVPFWDRTIELVIVTHPDADHIGGLPDLMSAYAVRYMLSSGATNDTDEYRLLSQAVNRPGGTEEEAAFRGTSIEFPDGGVFSIEYPLTPVPGNIQDTGTNASSIVTRFVYGQTSFLFTGDLPREEAFLPDEEPVTILKTAHHGSKYSTSDRFLEHVSPREAVISVGKNMYGHPSRETLERLSSHGVTVHRTDEEGDIVYVCDADACNYE